MITKIQKEIQVSDKPFLEQYLEFVDGVTSDASKNKEAFLARVEELYAAGCDVARLNTASEGLSSEGGEFQEVVKKIMWQGKPYDEANIFHMKRELGDIMWYFANACIALKLDPYEIIEENIRKLEARYPGGKFAIQRSEIRAEGDL
jgi:NTP pyrophosphatase (non-canonical NTP hydrolase)